MAVYKRNQCPYDPIQLRYYDVIPYDINSNWYYIKKITSTNYEANGNIVKTTNYYYEDSVHHS